MNLCVRLEDDPFRSRLHVKGVDVIAPAERNRPGPDGL